MCCLLLSIQFEGIDCLIHFLCCNIENFNDRNISRHFEERKVVSYDSFPLDNFSSCQLLDCPTKSVNRTFSMWRCKKCHVVSILHSFCYQDKATSMYRFLNWLLGLSDHICNAVMFSLSSSFMMCSRNTITQSLELLQSSDTATAEVQPTFCQRAAAKTVILFLRQWADWTSSC